MILQTVASINPAIGGPAVSVVQLALQLRALGQPVKLACLNYSEHGSLPSLPIDLLKSVECNMLTRPLRGWSPQLKKQLHHLGLTSTLIHNHGIWMFPNHYAAQAARKFSKPLITSPRGMLGSWALSYHAWPKKLLWHLREKNDLASVTAFHATSRQEAEHIRQAGFQQPIAVIPNGVTVPSAPSLITSPLETSVSALKGKRLALFLSRIHPKKGIIELVQAWSLLPQSLRNEWLLVIAGPDLTQHLPEVEAAIQKYAVSESILIHPSVSGDFKQALLTRAELFVLPSHEENFGIVVAEALAHGTPALTTHGTPWESLNTHLCGWWIPHSVDSLQKTLLHALSLSSADLALMGQRGKTFAQNELSWIAVAQKMNFFYDWIINKGIKPEFVQLD